MKTPVQRKLHARRKGTTLGAGAATRSRADDPLAPLQRRADTSQPVRQMQALQRQQAPVLQAANGDTDAEPQPQTQVPAIVSIDEGKVGSIYFDDGRIRGTHSDGPADERGEHTVIERFNVDLAAAEIDYRIEVKNKAHGGLKFEQWVAGILLNYRPNWVIAKLPKVADMPAGAPPANATLFENFRDTEGRFDGYHPSRGAAAKKMLSTSDVGALEAAVKLSAADATAAQKNRTFFDKLLKDAPDLAKEMRLPEEIDAEDAEDQVGIAENQKEELDELLGQDWADAHLEGQLADLPYFLKKVNRTRDKIWKASAKAQRAVANIRAGTSPFYENRAALLIRAKNAKDRAVKAGAKIDAFLPTISKNVTDFHKTYKENIKRAQNLPREVIEGNTFGKSLYKD